MLCCCVIYLICLRKANVYGFGPPLHRLAHVRKPTTLYILYSSESRWIPLDGSGFLYWRSVRQRFYFLSYSWLTTHQVSACAILFIPASAASLLLAIPPTRRRAIHGLDAVSNFLYSKLWIVPSRPVSLLFITIYNLLVIALSIWTVEAMLIRNETERVHGEEDEWTLGQIAAMILLATPAFTLAKILKSRMSPNRESREDELYRMETQGDANGKDFWCVLSIHLTSLMV